MAGRTFHKARHGDRPEQAAASRKASGIASNPRWAGWMAKGRLNRTEASTNPSKLKASGWPNTPCHRLPKGAFRSDLAKAASASLKAKGVDVNGTKWKKATVVLRAGGK